MSDQHETAADASTATGREYEPAMIEWVERQAHESLKARFATADILSREAQTTLTVLLAGVGGSAAYGATVLGLGQPSPISIAAAVTCAYLVLLSVLLVVLCMMFQSYPALYQDPLNILQREYTLNEVRAAEISNLQERILEAKTINDRKALRLNLIRIGAVMSPVVFVGVAIAVNVARACLP